MKALACLAILGLAIAGCSYHETVVQRPQPAATTYVTPDSSSSTTTTTVSPGL